MFRRTFTQAAAASAAWPAVAAGPIKAALLTHADGPHLGAYLTGLAETQEASSVVLSDPSGTVEPAARKALGARLAAVYRDPRALLDKERPALALITMEAALSPPVVRAALEAGCHVMAEKPACVRIADFEPLAALADSSRRNLMLALANRIDPVIVAARRLLGQGLIGKLYGAEIQIVADQTRLTRPAYHKTWIAQKARAGGGHLIWLGIHWLDLAMYLTGARVTAVAGFAGNVGGQPIDTEDSAVVALRFDNGAFGTMTSGYYLDKGYHSLLKLWGSQGWLEIRKHGSTGAPLEWYSNADPAAGVRRYTGPLEPSGYTPWVRHAVRAAAGMEPAVLSTAESLRVLRTVFASYRAAETGRTEQIA